jgi:hypothetical protein
MPTSKTVRDADTLATIIPFRPKRSKVAPHPFVPPPEPLHPSAHDPRSRRHLHSTPEQLSLFEADLAL